MKGREFVSDNGYDLTTGGPLATIGGIVLFVAVFAALVAVVGTLDAVFSAFAPGWAVLPLVLGALTILVVAALASFVRFREWLRYR